MRDIDLSNIFTLIKARRINVTDHAYEEAFVDNLAMRDVICATEVGEIIEQYPDREPHPRCLVLGFTPSNQPVHMIWEYDHEVQ